MASGPDGPHILPWLAAAARDAREQGGRHQAHIAAELRVNQATIRRFELAEGWPRDPDAMIAAYARDLDVHPSAIWADAVARWHADRLK